MPIAHPASPFQKPAPQGTVMHALPSSMYRLTQGFFTTVIFYVKILENNSNVQQQGNGKGTVYVHAVASQAAVKSDAVEVCLVINGYFNIMF